MVDDSDNGLLADDLQRNEGSYVRPTRRGIWLTAICSLACLLAIGQRETIAQERHAVAQEEVAPVRLPPVAESALDASRRVCRLTLEDAKQRALMNNKALALARLNIDSKGHATSAATKDYLPKLLGNVTYFHFDNPLGTVLTTRGTVLPGTIPVNVLNQNTALSTALVAQPITKLIAVNAAVQVSRADEAIAQVKLDQGAQQILSGVTQAYYALIGAQRIRSALALQAQMLQQVGGAQPSPELRIGLVELRQGLLQVEGQIQELTDQLNDLIDFPGGTMLELADPMPSALPIDSAEQAVQMSMTNNPEMREAAQTICKAEAAMKIARMAYLPDVNVVGGFANQTGASYIQQNITYVGVTGSYTFFEWGKKVDLLRQRQADLAMAQQNMQVVSDKVQLETRKTFGAFQQALSAYRLAEEMVQAYQDAEKSANGPAAMMAAKGATAKAELEYMKAEITYRVAHAQMASAIGCQ
jgi:outer membrane protein